MASPAIALEPAQVVMHKWHTAAADKASKVARSFAGVVIEDVVMRARTDAHSGLLVVGRKPAHIAVPEVLPNCPHYQRSVEGEERTAFAEAGKSLTGLGGSATQPEGAGSSRIACLAEDLEGKGSAGSELEAVGERSLGVETAVG